MSYANRVRLLETIGRWLGRVEVVLAGADDTLRSGEEALKQGDFMRARSFAHAVLGRLPGSPLGLALLADACELGGLDAELALTLEELAKRVASRAEVWVRLGRARQKTGSNLDEVREAYVRGLAVAEAGSEARREALLALADLDLEQGDGARAELWLERTAADKSADVVLRRAEARLAQRDVDGARKWIEALDSAPTDARAAMTRGRVLALAADPLAFASILRGYVLEAPGASELLSSTLAWIPSDELTRGRVRTVVEERGEAGLARWRAAFARADGRPNEARDALRDALAAGDASAARPLLDAALDDQDDGARVDALAKLPADAANDPMLADARLLPSAEDIGSAEKIAACLDALNDVKTERVLPWARALRKSAMRTWVPSGGAPAAWSPLLARLDVHARALHDLEATSQIASLAAERSRPVRLAIVGEFNAGKSTFINALIGAEIAPTGVLPTTATLHHLRYAQDAIARIFFEPGHANATERIVPIGELRATLKKIENEPIRRVEILLPISSLTRVEIIDTPGFNAPDARHTDTARAAFEEADAVIWLLDAAQPLKRTERNVLEEAKAARIPVQMLVNKADRLSTDDLAKVMELVVTSLDEIGLASWSPPLAMSARLALEGRLGDAAALEKSRWGAIEKLLDQEIIARSAELKERALRRRASKIVGELAARASALADEEATRIAIDAARTQALARAAAKIDRDGEDAAKKLAQSLEGAAKAWERDLDVVVTGLDREAAAADPILARYRVDRALAHLAPALASGLAALAEGTALTPPDLLPLARTLVRQTAFFEVGTRAATPLARAALASLVEYLSALAIVAPHATRAGGLRTELTALAEALA